MRDGAEGQARAPRRLGFAVVRGRSMQPTLYDGDRLLVVHGGRPRAGGLVVVRLPDGVVASAPMERLPTRAARVFIFMVGNPFVR